MRFYNQIGFRADSMNQVRTNLKYVVHVPVNNSLYYIVAINHYNFLNNIDIFVFDPYKHVSNFNLKWVESMHIQNY